MPLERLRFGWRSQMSALWWLGILYRRPAELGDRLATIPRVHAMRVGLGLMICGLLYALPLTIMCHLILGIAIGMGGPTQYFDLWHTSFFDFFGF